MPSGVAIGREKRGQCCRLRDWRRAGLVSADIGGGFSVLPGFAGGGMCGRQRGGVGDHLQDDMCGGPGVEGGSGLLVGWAVDDRTVTHGDQSETWEQVPFVAVDWGMCWGLLPGTTVTIRDATDTEAAALAEAGLA